MIKDIAEHNETIKGNERTLELLRRDFPQCFTKDGKFDLEIFQGLVGEAVPPAHEGYSLQFLGKSYASLVATTDTTTVIRPDEEHNSRPENRDSKNIYISGDNLDALKHLRSSYGGAVKCIYIDPPYNTGSDGFVYNDSFNYTAEQLQKRLGISEDAANRVLEMTTKGSASHSAWLAFMFPRLLLALDLLTPDGVIFISIDDNEQANLKLLCDTIFGEENFVAQMIWSAGRKNDSKFVSVSHEYILCYALNFELLKNNDIVWRQRKEGLEDIYKKYNELSKSFGADYPAISRALKEWYASLPVTHPARNHKHYNCADAKGIYFPSDISWPGGGGPKYEVLHPVTKKPVKVPNRGWIYPTPERMQEQIDSGLVHFGPDESSVPCSKTYLADNEEAAPYSVFYQDGRAATKRLMSLMGGKVFENPKDETIISQLLSFSQSSKDYIVLDFFSGSATTAHAVMQLNATDGGNRKFIMVQLPEKTKQDSDARKAGFLTIDEIGQERIRRAATKIKEEKPMFTGDLGFKHYTLEEPSDNTFAKLEEFNPNVFFSDNILDEFGLDTVLRTWAVRDGYGFNAEITPIDLNGYTAYQCGRHLYLVNPGLGIYNSAAPIVALIDLYNNIKEFRPENVVLFGYSFNYSETEALKKNLLPLRDGIKNLKVNLDIRY